MKFALFFLCLLTLAFSQENEEYFEYSEYYAEYGCSLGKTNKCCWSKYDNCCSPATGPRTCEEKFTYCCKKKIYSMEEGNYEIVFYHN